MFCFPCRRPHMSIDDDYAIYSKIPRPFLPVGQTSYASDYWPERFRRQAYRPTPDIDPEILRTMKVVGTTGYARNINNMRRNQVQYADVIKKQRERGDREDRHDRHGSGGGGGPDKGGGPASAVIEVSAIPKHYRKIAIKLSKMGSDDFDFDRYGRKSTASYVLGIEKEKYLANMKMTQSQGYDFHFWG